MTDWGQITALIGGLVILVGAIATAAVQIINALKDNRAATAAVDTKVDAIEKKQDKMAQDVDGKLGDLREAWEATAFAKGGEDTRKKMVAEEAIRDEALAEARAEIALTLPKEGKVAVEETGEVGEAIKEIAGAAKAMAEKGT